MIEIASIHPGSAPGYLDLETLAKTKEGHIARSLKRHLAGDDLRLTDDRIKPALPALQQYSGALATLDLDCTNPKAVRFIHNGMVLGSAIAASLVEDWDLDDSHLTFDGYLSVTPDELQRASHHYVQDRPTLKHLTQTYESMACPRSQTLTLCGISRTAIYAAMMLSDAYRFNGFIQDSNNEVIAEFDKLLQNQNPPQEP